ncbi:MAG: aminotransferase class I/II-fold pyridoxal phosphate-dependent enzyme [Chloroflexi bacterium]|nr:aminotransferase class I/II-fold pyridoxal phosphate-dependent enzyme [Chloroflexota bacterium]
MDDGGLAPEVEDSGRQHRFATRAVRGKPQPLPAERPVATPIYQSSTFAFDDASRYARALERPGQGFSYTRYENPTTAQLEAIMADLEGGAHALAAASGMGAISAVLLALLGSGEHIVLQRSLYGGTYSLVTDLGRRYGVASTFVDPNDLEAVRAAIRTGTRILYAETIANPTMGVADLPALGAIARETGTTLVVDNTIASPYLCRPIEHGASVVVHSATKYLGGHSDVVAGVAVFADASQHWAAWQAMIDLGASPDPFASWLVLRGIKTLPVRMRQHCETARAVATWLEGHPKVRKVYWPGLPSHRDHAVARRILADYSGMLSFDLVGGREAGEHFIEGTRLAHLAASLGGVETLVTHPASTTHRQLDAEALRRAGIEEGLIRVSLGLEDPEDILADFEQALEKA